MMIRRLVTALSIAAAMGCASTFVACGPPAAKAANVQVGSLPSGASFKGVWFNPSFGHLHIVPSGDTIAAKWESDAKGKWGRMSGKITGDVIRFEWEEFTKGTVSATNARKGKGYFKYQPAPEDTKDPPHLKGEWGFDDKDAGGGTWDCVLELNIEPNFSKIGGSDEGTEGGWDQTPGKK